MKLANPELIPLLPGWALSPSLLSLSLSLWLSVCLTWSCTAVRAAGVWWWWRGLIWVTWSGHQRGSGPWGEGDSGLELNEDGTQRHTHKDTHRLKTLPASWFYGNRGGTTVVFSIKGVAWVCVKRGEISVCITTAVCLPGRQRSTSVCSACVDRAWTRVVLSCSWHACVSVS